MQRRASGELELRKLRESLAWKTRSVIVPIISAQVCLLSIPSAHLAPFKPVILYALFHCVVEAALDCAFDAANSNLIGSHLQLRDQMNAIACTVGYYICASRCSPENEELMNLISCAVLPVLLVHLSDRFELPTQLWLLAHLLLTCVRLARSLEAARQLLGLVALHALLFRIGRAKAVSAKSSELSGTMYSTMSSMLNLVCDGFVILGADSVIVGASDGAELCLAMSDLCGKHYTTVFGGKSADGPRWGLSTAWFKRPDQKSIKLELCTVPCQLPPEGVSCLLERELAVSATGSCICAMRIVEDERKTAQPEASAKPPAAQPVTPSPLAAKSTLAPLFFKSPWRFESGIALQPGNYRKVKAAPVQAGVEVAESSRGERVAIREISLAAMTCQRDFPAHLHAMSREADALKKIAWASPVVIRLVDCWLQNDFSRACIVTEWLPQTFDVVLQRLRAEHRISVEKHDARRWLTHMLTGVAAIHAAGFVHRDIRPCNIWLTEDLQRCKIAGLGISKPLHRKGAYSNRHTNHDEDDAASAGASDLNMEDTGSMISGISGVSGLTAFTALNGANSYSSPEMICDRRYTEKTDLFSLGCILLEMLTLEPVGDLVLGAPGSDTSPDEAAWSAIADTRARCFEVQVTDIQALSVNCAELPNICASLLSPEPNLRPRAGDIVAGSQRLQMHLPDLVRESSKLRAVILKHQRKVHFDAGGVGSGDDSGSELAPAVP